MTKALHIKIFEPGNKKATTRASIDFWSTWQLKSRNSIRPKNMAWCKSAQGISTSCIAAQHNRWKRNQWTMY